MLYTILANVLGVFLYLFLFWRRLKEDYSANLILSTAFWGLIGLGLGFAAMAIVKYDAWFWGAFVGIAAGAGVSIYRFRLKPFEVLDALVLSLSPWLLLFFLFSALRDENYFTLGASLILLGVYLFYFFVNANYKSFSWYRSGRVGFSGLVTLALFFLTRAAAGFSLPTMLSFLNEGEAIVSGLFAVFSIAGIVYLSRSKK